MVVSALQSQSDPYWCAPPGARPHLPLSGCANYHCQALAVALLDSEIKDFQGSLIVRKMTAPTNRLAKTYVQGIDLYRAVHHSPCLVRQPEASLQLRPCSPPHLNEDRVPSPPIG